MSTKYVYQNLKLDDQTFHPAIDDMVTAIREGDLPGITSRMGNVLESAVGNRLSDITALKNSMLELGAEASLMSGSGSTVFGIFTDKDRASQALSRLSADPIVHHGTVIAPFQKSLH